MGLYGMCFMLCAAITYSLGKHNGYDQRVPVMMDSGNPYVDHVRGAHATMQEQKWSFMNIGSLTFEDDATCNALQAADVVAWASRCREAGTKFDKGYEPLANLFDEAHVQETCPPKALLELVEAMNRLRDEGKFVL
jgi:hypothetical protein